MHPSGRGPFGAEPHNGRGLVYLDGPRGSKVAKPAIDAVSRYMNRGGAFPTSVETEEILRESRGAVANMTTLTFANSRAGALRGTRTPRSS